MTQDDGGYEMKPAEKPEGPGQGPDATNGSRPPRPGEPGWVPPVPVVEKAEAEEGPAVDPDVEKNKGMAVAAYVCFVVPLVAAPNSKFARFHANQGLLAFLGWCVAIFGNVALHLFRKHVLNHLDEMVILHGFFSCGIVVIQAALLVGALALMLFGIIQAANGLRKPLPYVGHWELIK